MKNILFSLLTALTFIGLSSSVTIAEENAATNSKPGPVQALDKAKEAQAKANAEVDEQSKEAATITDDEGLADEEMEMPEEDLDDEAPAGSQAE